MLSVGRTILIVFVFSLTLYAANGAEIAVYTDGNLGAWEDGVKAFENFLDWKGVSHERVTAIDVNTLNLSDYYQAIYFPGGYAYYYKSFSSCHKDCNNRKMNNILKIYNAKESLSCKTKQNQKK